MKDTAFLLGAGGVVACVAWVLWHFPGDEAFGAITTLALLGVLADHVRLRRRLRARK
ncbi:MAG TPA: hypothetical protein VF861_14020 [Telluria sp.]